MVRNKRTRHAVGDVVAAHPGIDQVLPVLVAALLFMVPDVTHFVPSGARGTIYATMATVSGLTLAAATFVCTMTYQSANILMAGIVRSHAAELRRNWTTIISSNLVTALLPLAALAMDTKLPHIGIVIASYAVTLLCVRFMRAVWWLQYSLFRQEQSANIIGTAKAAPRPDIREAMSLREQPRR